MILEESKGVHCEDLGESFPTSIFVQNVVSIQPRTSPEKFEWFGPSPIAHLSTKFGAASFGGSGAGFFGSGAGFSGSGAGAAAFGGSARGVSPRRSGAIGGGSTPSGGVQRRSAFMLSAYDVY